MLATIPPLSFFHFPPKRKGKEVQSLFLSRIKASSVEVIKDFAPSFSYRQRGEVFLTGFLGSFFFASKDKDRHSLSSYCTSEDKFCSSFPSLFLPFFCAATDQAPPLRKKALYRLFPSPPATL